MRRLSALLPALVALALVFGGCGGGNNTTISPLDDAVGYFSRDAPFVAAIETDPGVPEVQQFSKLVSAFPGARILGDVARLPLVRWDRDVRPQLGAPLVVGLAKPAAGRGALAIATVVAMRLQSPLKAKQVLLRQPGFRARGKESGVRVYENTLENRYIAVDGDVAVGATDRAILAQALAMRRSDNRMRASGFRADLAGLPASGLARVSADPRALIGADPRLRPALQVKWLAAMRRFGAVLKASGSGLAMDFRLATDKGSLSQADLPLTPGKQPIRLIGGRADVQLGIRGPDRLARLAVQVFRAIAPAHALALKVLEPKGIDLERQIPHHLTGVLVAAFNRSTRRFALRTDLNEPDDVKSAFAALAPALPALAAAAGIRGLGIATPEAGENFFALANAKGRAAVFGVVGHSLVAASEPRRAADLTSEPGRSVAGSPALVLKMDTRVFAPFAAAAPGNLTATMSIARDGLRGHADLKIVKRP